MLTKTPQVSWRWLVRLTAWLHRLRRPNASVQATNASVPPAGLPEPIPAAPVPPAVPIATEPMPIATEPEPIAPPQPGPRTGETHDFTYHHLRRDLADIAADTLEHFEIISARTAEDAYFDMPRLEEMWGRDYLLLDRNLGERMKGGDKWGAIDNASAKELTEVVWPVSIGVAYPIGTPLADADARDQADAGSLDLFHLETVSMQDVRGLGLTRVAPKMVRLMVGEFGDNRKWMISQCYMGLLGEKWLPLKPIHHGKLERFDKQVRAMMSMALSTRYEWHVALGTIKDGPRILLPTNPTGCLKLFNNRDKDPNKTRREALRHWVEQHYRDSEQSGVAFVCNHLRGNTRFNWAGFGCELYVSAYDLEMNEYFKKQATEWRAQRKHNIGRVRVRLKRRQK